MLQIVFNAVDGNISGFFCFAFAKQPRVAQTVGGAKWGIRAAQAA